MSDPCWSTQVQVVFLEAKSKNKLHVATPVPLHTPIKV